MPSPVRLDDDRGLVSAEVAVQRFYVEVGRRVRQARQAQGLTQDELARALQLARSSIANLEAGRQRVPAHTLLLAAHALHARLVDLLPPLELEPPRPDILGLPADTPSEHRQLLQRLISSPSENSA